jgi:hypothetical protein
MELTLSRFMVHALLHGTKAKAKDIPISHRNHFKTNPERVNGHHHQHLTLKVKRYLARLGHDDDDVVRWEQTNRSSNDDEP